MQDNFEPNNNENRLDREPVNFTLPTNDMENSTNNHQENFNDSYMQNNNQNYYDPTPHAGYEYYYNPKQSEPKPKKEHLFARKAGKLIAGALAFGLIAGASFQGFNAVYGYFNPNSISTLSAKPTVNVSTTNTSSTGDIVTTVTDMSSVVKEVMPSIVSITSTVTTTYYDWFNNSYDQESEGSGSGIIIGKSDKELLIVTNNHVIDGSTKLQISFIDDKSVEATVKGTDTDADLAVVSVDLSKLEQSTLDSIKIAVLGDSKALNVGEPAIAIGNALGYGQSVTTGCISALERTVQLEDKNMTLIQTDAAINPGNSGGALINIRGEVIGINTIKYSSVQVDGMGFAIPISTASPIINDLMNQEVIPEEEKAFLGISGSDLTSDFTTQFNMPTGIYIVKISEGSPAEKAGLQYGDIITEIGGRTVETMESLQNVISNKRSGDEVTLKVMRQGKNGYEEIELTATLGAKKDYTN